MTSVLFTNVRIFDGTGAAVSGRGPVAGVAVLKDAARLLGVMKDGVFHKDPQKGPARGRFSRPAA